MGIFEGMLITSDFDGTLTDSKGCIPEVNIEAIRYFINEGGKFTVSTGRTKAGFHNFSSEIINAPVLLGNGAMAYDYSEHKVSFVNGISADAIEILEIIMERFPQISMELYAVDDKSYVINPNINSINHFKGLKIADYKVVDKLERSYFPMVKIMLSVEDKTHEVQQFLSEINLGEMKYIPCNGSYIEILSLSAGKGRALHQLADFLSIDKAKAYSIGDGSNDVDMLEDASIGFVPSSADKLAAEKADIIVCSSDEGAVAGAISYLKNKVLSE